MSVQLLDKTRKINKLLHNSSSSKVVFNDICQVLMETLSSNILVLSKKGKVLGVSICPGVDEITELIDDKIGGFFWVEIFYKTAKNIELIPDRSGVIWKLTRLTEES